MRKSVLKLISLFLIVLAVIIIWYSFFYSIKCQDLECFKENLIECKRANYLNTQSWAYQYKIKGIKEGECIVGVKLTFAGLEPKFEQLVGKSMICSIPLRKLDLPESELDYCSGPLKEGIQLLVIKDLYQYASQNLGK